MNRLGRLLFLAALGTATACESPTPEADVVEEPEELQHDEVEELYEGDEGLYEEHEFYEFQPAPEPASDE